MMKKIEKQLTTLRNLHLTEDYYPYLTDEQKIAYVEDRLEDKERQKVEATIIRHKDLTEEITILKNMVETNPVKSPTSHLSNIVMRKLGLSETVMEIAIKKIDNFIDVLVGKELIDTEYTQSLIPTRGNYDNIIVFKSSIDPYHVICIMQSTDNEQFIHFSLENDDGLIINNCRFIVKQNNKVSWEIITDRTGVTPRRNIDIGDHEVEIQAGRKTLGIIKINIS